MGFRTFVDSTGREWTAFDVVPRSEERRQLDRRMMARLSDLFDFDDRRDHDRRVTVGGRSPLASGVSEGWLCFERGVDRRRLMPIPDDWQQCTDKELEAYCQSARPVHRAFVSPDQFAERRR